MFMGYRILSWGYTLFLQEHDKEKLEAIVKRNFRASFRNPRNLQTKHTQSSHKDYFVITTVIDVTRFLHDNGK